jgi:hypothetical protein
MCVGVSHHSTSPATTEKPLPPTIANQQHHKRLPSSLFHPKPAVSSKTNNTQQPSPPTASNQQHHDRLPGSLYHCYPKPAASQSTTLQPSTSNQQQPNQPASPTNHQDTNNNRRDNRRPCICARRLARIPELEHAPFTLHWAAECTTGA